MTATRRLMTARYVLVAAATSIAVAAVIGLPTDVLPNPWFTRMTPVRTADLVLWPLASITTGALLATYVRASGFAEGRGALRGLASGGLGWLAIGCPVCNKVVVALLGFSGALNLFGPVQPFVGGAGVALAVAALALRLRAVERSCPVPTALQV